MFSTRLERAAQTSPLLLAAIIVWLSPAALAKTPRQPDDPPQPMAQILAVIKKVNSSEMIADQATGGEVILVRARPGCGDSDVVKKGLLLCKGDRIKTSGVKLRVAFDDPKDRNEFTLDDGSEVTIGSFDCSICRWLASLSNRYTNRVPHAGLTNKGTVYEVNAEPDSSVSIMVFEGELEIDLDRRANPAATPDAANRSTTAGDPVREGAAAPVKVPALYKIIINADGTAGELERITEATLPGALSFSSEAEIGLHRRPAEAGGTVAKLPNFPNDSVRNDRFKQARSDSFLHPDRADAFETLGKVYNDWGDAQRALELFAKAATVGRNANANWQPSLSQRINEASALRQLGQEEDALVAIMPVVDDNPDSPVLAEALNVRGSIYYAKARRLLRRNLDENGFNEAETLLASAGADYVRAKSSATGVLVQYIEVNRAQVLKIRGDIALRQKNFDKAVTNYKDAIEALKGAYGRTDNPQNRIASLLVGRAHAALANTYAIQDTPDPTQSENSYNTAERVFKKLIQDADRDRKQFADPYCNLASLYQILNNPAARENYDKCVAYTTAALVTDADLPDVTGMHRPTAIQVLAEAGFEAVIDTDGIFVASQDPPAATQQRVKIGSKVKLRMIIPARD